VSALRAFPILGVRTNLTFLTRLLQHPGFRTGQADTGFVDAHVGVLVDDGEPPVEALAAAAAARPGRMLGPTPAGAPAADPWARLAGWGR
jgi:acetyl/propionyl-CoA carboxylase alpha subunit